MNKNINKALKRLTLKIIIFDVIIFLGVIGLSIVLTSHFKQRLAGQLSEAFRAPLIAGDNRQIMLDMSRPVFNDFIGFSWKPDNARDGFSVPQDLQDSEHILYSSTLIELFFDEAHQIKLGELKFYYPRWAGVSTALELWFFLTVVFVIFGYHERSRILREYSLAMELQISESKTLMAAQVAHDIRSPLYALDAALKNTVQLPEKQRVIVRHAVNRIRDIANNLLEKNRLPPGPASTAAATVTQAAGGPSEAHLLSSLIDPVITEKRLQFETKPGIAIDFALTSVSYGLFAKVQPVEFGRMISNLVNNAVEALGDKGAVDVHLAHKDKTIQLIITDNGKGIPPEILAKLGRRGETHGKAGGSGLGLFHARTTAETWGGSLAITSEPGKGTAITVKLPQAAPPSYFAGELKLAAGRPVLVLDDDPGIHQLWRGRFESARLKEHNIEAHHFSEPEQLRAWVKANTEKAASAVCLFDYELSGFKETGLSLAEELNLRAQTILVTSRSEEPRIIAECVRLGIRMIPKGLASLVPVLIASPAPAGAAPARAVLLDDDAITHMNWEWSAQEHGVDLKAFTSPAEFMAALGDFPKDIPLYIDSELGGGIKGEDIAAEIKEKGYTNIYLTTGHPPEKFAHLPWLRVVTKEAPWGEKTEN